MRVRDLIESLKEEDPDMEVRLELHHGHAILGTTVTSDRFEIQTVTRFIHGPANYVVLYDDEALKPD